MKTLEERIRERLAMLDAHIDQQKEATKHLADIGLYSAAGNADESMQSYQLIRDWFAAILRDHEAGEQAEANAKGMPCGWQPGRGGLPTCRVIPGCIHPVCTFRDGAQAAANPPRKPKVSDVVHLRGIARPLEVEPPCQTALVLYSNGTYNVNLKAWGPTGREALALGAPYNTEPSYDHVTWHWPEDD